MPMRAVPGGIAGAVGFGIGAGLRAAARFGLGAALALTAVFFLAATFLPTVFLRTATLPVEVFFFLVVVLAFFLVAMGSTSTLKTETVRENDASFINRMPDAWQYHAPSAPKNQFLHAVVGGELEVLSDCALLAAVTWRWDHGADYSLRISSTGQCVNRITPSATLPSSRWFRPRRPCVPMTSSSADIPLASSTITCAM